ncbi:transcription factor S-II, central domain-containing protein, partial [Xylariales sp. PMI_506]
IGEPEPRRSVRATKGQHTKAFEALENAPQAPKRKQAASATKKGKKASEKDEEEDDEEVIRCVCGATTQEDDEANEPWIACEKCGAWQHNVCMGMSIFDDDLPKEYFCEQCRPQDHKELLAAIAKGEKIWLTRRQRHEEENKKKKGKKGKGKRVSDPKERSSPAASAKAKPSPTPEVKEEETTAKGKRKPRDHSQGPQSKLRKVSETQAAPVALPKYTPPADLPESIDKLEGPRKKATDGLRKQLDVALDLAVKNHLFTIPEGTTKKALTERHAIEIERAVHDTHGSTNAVANQLRTLMFNLKKNVNLAARVFNRTLTPPALASMSSDEMATEELQRETAEMKARAEQQSTLITDDGPRVRRTHKGEEIIETDSASMATEETPSALRRQSVRDGPGAEVGKAADQGDKSGKGAGPLRIDTQGKQSPKQGDFDINKVFSSVKSPSASHQRRPSAPVPSAGPGHDPEVDRLLQDDADSPPYSPTENLDPDVIWQGHLSMTNLADISTVAKFAGGADLKKLKGIAWENLFPPLLTVAGRIPEDKAVPYLCGLRYNNQVDLVITTLSPANPSDPTTRTQFLSVIDYFRSKKRYGVVGERKLGNVRDTYLVPVSEGDGPVPELLQNIEGHSIPRNRPDPILLLVFVIRDEKLPVEQAAQAQQATPTPSAQTPTPVPDRKHSAPPPSWSPATPQGAFPNAPHPPPHQSHTPIPPPVIPGQPAPAIPQRQAPVAQPPPPPPPAANDVNALRQAQAEGEQKARQVLGPLFNSPTVTFLLPHAARMKEGEWNAVKRCLEKDPKARDDLPLLSRLLTEEGNSAR